MGQRHMKPIDRVFKTIHDYPIFRLWAFNDKVIIISRSA